MSEWSLKRFWNEVQIAREADGFAVRLDQRPVKTPAKATLVVPTRALAEAIAAEWDAQEEGVNPEAMPFTRSANAAIDKVSIQHAEVAEMIGDYADSDLLCYRAADPQGLVDRQALAWDPYLDWAATALDARLEPRTGLMHVPQSPQALARLKSLVHEMHPFALVAFHDLVSLTGSLVLGFAAARHHAEPDEIWQASRVDELWQAERWGDDTEAREISGLKQRAFLHAMAFWDAAHAPLE